MARKQETGSAPVDVLAAEGFGVPAPDPALRPEVLNLPPDPIADEPHDVLAAEEFAMPSPDEAHKVVKTRHKRVALQVALNVVSLAGLWVLRQARRRRKSGTAESD
jgi:hypothetical protein